MKPKKPEKPKKPDLASLDPLNKPDVVRFTLRIPAPVLDWIEAEAGRQETSANHLIVHLLVRAIEDWEDV